MQVVDELGQPLHDRSFGLHVEVENGRDPVHVNRTLEGVSETILRDLPPNERFWVANRNRKYGEEWQFEGAVTGVTPGVGESLPIVLACLDEPAPPAFVVRGRLVFPKGIHPLDLTYTSEVHVDEVAPGIAVEAKPRHQDMYRYGEAADDGSFELVLSGLAVELAASGSLYFGLEISCSGDRGRKVRAVVAGSERSVEAGQIDLGDIALERVGVLCRGQVVDQDGLPVAGAGLQSGGGQPGGATQETIMRALWIGEPGASDAQGNFVLRGVLPEGELAVRATCPGYRSTEWLTVVDPNLPVRLVLEGAGAIVGQLILEEGQRAGFFDVGIGQMSGPVEWASCDEESGEFGWQELDSGTYTVQVRLDATREVVVTIPGVEVVAGETTRDERMAAIRLQGVARTIKLSILGEDDEPVPYAAIKISRDGFDLGKTWYWKGHERMFVAELPVTLWVSARGYAPTRFDVAGSSAVLRMQPGVLARARLAKPLTLPPFGAIEWDLSPMDEFPGLLGDYAGNGVVFDGTGQTKELGLCVPGRWGTSLILTVTMGDRAAWAMLGSHPEPWIFNVPEGGGVAELVVPVTQDEVDAAWAEIQARH